MKKYKEKIEANAAREIQQLKANAKKEHDLHQKELIKMDIDKECAEKIHEEEKLRLEAEVECAFSKISEVMAADRK